MAVGPDESEPSAADGTAEFFGKLALVASVFCACVVAPFVTARLLGPWVGVLTAVVSL